ncbi:Reverse transcriptase (RNA-dependent DNA polymerase) [Popillia japonica]|uniref:Reverse transcriptase (RNA-dependent DNA polymerase) n=1 Tax=Popillia japonica TaxID=7064 RepID=A0AAW1ITV0_POPJA
MEKNGFTLLTANPCIYYIWQIEVEKLLVAIYVDDGFIAESTQDAIDSFLGLLTSEFKITVGSLDSFLGVLIERDEQGVRIPQRPYVEKILKRFGMENCKIMKTPTEKQQSDESSNDSLHSSVLYKSVVGSLLNLACVIRPDIAYAASRVARTNRPRLDLCQTHISLYAWLRWHAISLHFNCQ